MGLIEMFSIDDLQEMANKRDINYWQTHKKILSILPVYIENAENKVFYPANIFNNKKFILYFFSPQRVESISSDGGKFTFDSQKLSNVHLKLEIQPDGYRPSHLDIKAENGFELSLNALEDSVEDAIPDYNEAVEAVYRVLNK